MLQRILVIIVIAMQHVYQFLLISVVGRWNIGRWNMVKGTRKPKNKRVPERVPEPVPEQVPEQVAENIRAFNTITKLLSFIPRHEPIPARDNLANKKWQSSLIRQELKLLDAFSQLMVSYREVAAMASSRTIDLALLGSISGGQDEVVRQEGATDDTNEGTGLLGRMWATFADMPYWLIGGTNPRRDTAATCSGVSGPTLVTPVAPRDIGERTALQYMKDLEEKWQVLFNEYVLTRSHPIS